MFCFLKNINNLFLKNIIRYFTIISAFGSKSLGSQPGVLDCSLYLLLRVPESLPEEKRFDMMMLALILLINLVEQCDDNKQFLIESKAPSSIENIFDGKYFTNYFIFL